MFNVQFFGDSSSYIIVARTIAYIEPYCDISLCRFFFIDFYFPFEIVQKPIEEESNEQKQKRIDEIWQQCIFDFDGVYFLLPSKFALLTIYLQEYQQQQ